MDYSRFIKKLQLPNDFSAPKELTFEDLIARPLTRSDLQADIDAVNSSLETIRNTRGGSWPEEAVSEEFDVLDLVWHEREFREDSSFAYVVYDANNTYIGCFYLYPLGVRTELTEALLEYNIDASWWVTASAYEQGYYQKLYQALQRWLPNDLMFTKVYYSNKEMPA